MYTSAWIFPALILFGGIVTLIRDRNKPVKAAPGDEGIQSYGMGKVRRCVTHVSSSSFD
jgi:hypothetical protein